MKGNRSDSKPGWMAGATQVDFTPLDPQFLCGYPHIPRISTGTHDPLLSSALYLSDGETEVLFIANDILFIPKDLAGRARSRIEAATGIPARHILVSATHTHSGPVTLDYVSSEADPVVPRADARVLQRLEDAVVTAGTRARAAATRAETGSAVADATGIGTHRHDPRGPSDLSVPLLAVRELITRKPIALMLICSMHPTVLHEDSTLISGDFPGLARRLLQETTLGAGTPILHHTGPAGNQSPRHVTTANTFAEAGRLGGLLADAIQRALGTLTYTSGARLEVRNAGIELPPRLFDSVEEARRKLDAAVTRLEHLRGNNASRQDIRTAECDGFGAEEAVTLARAAADGRLDRIRHDAMPAEIQVFTVGDRLFAGWPGECFVEYGLAVKSRFPEAAVITLANGELQGYIVTPEAARSGCYEANNAVFAPESGAALVEQTLRLMEAAHGPGPGT